VHKLTDDWHWMLSAGWKHKIKRQTPMSDRVNSDVEYKNEIKNIILNTAKAYYYKHSDNSCRLVVDMLTVSSDVVGWLKDASMNKNSDFMKIKMQENWPGNINEFRLMLVSVKNHRQYSYVSASVKVELIPLDESGDEVDCQTMSRKESSELAALSLHNRLSDWEYLQPHIESLEIKNKYIIPWLSNKGWQHWSKE